MTWLPFLGTLVLQALLPPLLDVACRRLTAVLSHCIDAVLLDPSSANGTSRDSPGLCAAMRGCLHAYLTRSQQHCQVAAMDVPFVWFLLVSLHIHTGC